MGRGEGERDRLRALTRAAYTAAAGHLEVDPEDPDPRVRRWWPSTRAASVAGVVVLLVAVVLGLRAWAGAPADPVPLPTGAATAGTPAPGAPDGTAPPDGVVPADGAVPPDAQVDGSEVAGTGVRDGGAGGTTADGRVAGPDGVPATGPAAHVVVHVAGEVRRPGVVELPAGSRVSDAVAAAGGAGSDADLGGINLARVLSDGEQVHVPRPGEQPAPVPQAAPGEVAAEPSPVNLNTATLAELDALPGIGPAIAQRILDWRAANGAFTDPAELEEVSGIGPATMDELEGRVTV